MGGTGEACTRPGPSEAREPKGRAFLQRSGREEPRRGGEKSSTLGLRAAPATIGKPPCNRERGSHVDELMNRGMRTGVGGQRTKTREKRGWENPRKLYRTACGPEHCWFAEQTVGFAAETIRNCPSISPLASARPRCPCPTASAYAHGLKPSRNGWIVLPVIGAQEKGGSDDEK